jgi:uncharacterized protein (DUF433 family)
MDWSEYVHTDPDILAGKPVLRGTRLAVELILDKLAGGWTAAELLDNYPTLTEVGIHACFAYAADAVRGERVFTIGVPG